jgi:hypothetical protein
MHEYSVFNEFNFAALPSSGILSPEIADQDSEF